MKRNSFRRLVSVKTFLYTGLKTSIKSLAPSHCIAPAYRPAALMNLSYGLAGGSLNDRSDSLDAESLRRIRSFLVDCVSGSDRADDCNKDVDEFFRTFSKISVVMDRFFFPVKMNMPRLFPVHFLQSSHGNRSSSV